MVRSVARSRGCGICRRRKIKCDERTPQCSQCSRIGKNCPGPSLGVVVVRMLGPPHPDLHPKSTKSRAQRTTLSQYQPSRAGAFEQVFIAHFISSFAKPSISNEPHQSWMQYLPAFLSRCELVRPSIRAATLAYYAYCTEDPAIEREADQCYMEALRRQQSWLLVRYSRDHKGGAQYKLVPTDEEICASMMLLYFELLRPTSIASWLKHLDGACRLIELRGPLNCRVGVSRLFLQSLRVLTVRYSIKSRTPSPFASKDWCAVPDSEVQFIMTDELINILLCLPNFLPRADDTASPPGVGSTQPFITVLDKLKLVDLLQRLREFEKKYLEDYHRVSGASAMNLESKSLTSRASSDKPWCGNSGGDFCTIDPSSMFNAATIIIMHCILSQHDAWSSEEQKSFAEEQRRSSVSILQNAIRIQGQNPKGINPGACLQFVFPLEAVASFSADADERDAAQSILDRMGWARL